MSASPFLTNQIESRSTNNLMQDSQTFMVTTYVKLRRGCGVERREGGVRAIRNLYARKKWAPGILPHICFRMYQISETFCAFELEDCSLKSRNINLLINKNRSRVKIVPRGKRRSCSCCVW